MSERLRNNTADYTERNAAQPPITSVLPKAVPIRILKRELFRSMTHEIPMVWADGVHALRMSLSSPASTSSIFLLDGVARPSSSASSPSVHSVTSHSTWTSPVL